MAIEVDAATLHRAANDVRSTRQEVSGQLKTLEGLIGELSSAWRGQAATGFQNVMVRWQGDTNKLLTALDAIGDQLDQSGTQHSTNDEQQDEMFKKYGSALG